MLLIQLAKARQKIAMIVFSEIPKDFPTADKRLSNPFKQKSSCLTRVLSSQILQRKNFKVRKSDKSTTIQRAEALEWTNKTPP
jgi:hypothetical protein